MNLLWETYSNKTRIINLNLKHRLEFNFIPFKKKKKLNTVQKVSINTGHFTNYPIYRGSNYFTEKHEGIDFKNNKRQTEHEKCFPFLLMFYFSCIIKYFKQSFKSFQDQQIRNNEIFS